MEKKLQREIIKWLRGTGAYVIKTRPGMGTPTGCPDIIALYKGKWLVIEVKRDAKAPYGPGQAATLQHLRNWSEFVYTAYPENWPGIKAELLKHFF